MIHRHVVFRQGMFEMLHHPKSIDRVYNQFKSMEPPSVVKQQVQDMLHRHNIHAVFVDNVFDGRQLKSYVFGGVVFRPTERDPEQLNHSNLLRFIGCIRSTTGSKGPMSLLMSMTYKFQEYEWVYEFRFAIPDEKHRTSKL